MFLTINRDDIVDFGLRFAKGWQLVIHGDIGPLHLEGQYLAEGREGELNGSFQKIGLMNRFSTFGDFGNDKVGIKSLTASLRTSLSLSKKSSNLKQEGRGKR